MIRIAAIVLLLTAAASVFAQPGGGDERRAAITLLRAINTAENAVKGRNGKYVHLTELLEHQAMGQVKAGIAINGGVISYQGGSIRLALSTDAMQYQVSVIPADTCGWAAFTDERGLIYTGKVLDCK